MVAIWVLSLAVAAQWGAFAQSPLPEPVSGDNLGFQTIGEHDGTTVGYLVIKMNGEWRTASLAQAVPSSSEPRILPLR